MSTGQMDNDWVGPCHPSGRTAAADDPHESWDLDVGDVQSWLRAQRSASNSVRSWSPARLGEPGCTRIRRGTRRR